MNPYRFCPRCGGKLNPLQKHSFRCEKCLLRHFINQKVSITLVLENDRGEILFAKRKNDPWKGTWNTPGGFIDPGETAEQAARREALEETGIKVKKLTYLGTYLDKYPLDGIKSPLLAIGFAAQIGKQKIKAGDDATSVCFFPSSKIPYGRIGVQSDKKLLQDYFRLRSIDKK